MNYIVLLIKTFNFVVLKTPDNKNTSQANEDKDEDKADNLHDFSVGKVATWKCFGCRSAQNAL